MVYIQDIWSINGSASYNKGDKSGSFSFNDINFLGFGNEFKGGLRFDNALSHGWDWEGSYTYNNIQRTFLAAKLYYTSGRDNQQYGLMIGRDFISPVISWAGAIAQDWQNIRYPNLRNIHQQVETVRLNRQDYWFGYAFDIKPFDPTIVNQNRFNIAGRIIRTVFSQKPDFDTMNLFQDNTFYLGRIGYSYRTYFQERYIFGLGRTEDIPLINMIELIFGLEKGATTSQPYYGLKTGYSFYNDNLGYVYGEFQTGAFRSNDKWLNRTSVLELLYFSKLNTIGTYKWRHYLGSRYSYSYDPLRPEDILNINNEGGLRGFSDGSLKGNKKLILNYEADIFVPLKFLGFKLAVITFADFGLISPANSSFFASRLYQGYGIGFRIKNEHLIFPPIQFMIGFYPNSPQESALPETYSDRIRLGDRLKVRMPSGNTVTGEVIYKAAEGDFATQRDVSRRKRDIKTVSLKVRLDNSQRNLVPGMTAEVLVPQTVLAGKEFAPGAVGNTTQPQAAAQPQATAQPTAGK
jgi:hypothetical protein